MDSAETVDRNARLLLVLGMLAGPLYVVVGVAQAFLREGFDPTRHALSLLSLGEWGWIQIGNFIVSGLFVIAGAVGIRRALRRNGVGAFGQLLLAVYGISLVAAGVFVADPMESFPPGTPPGSSETGSWHGTLHFMSGGIGFLAVIAACFVFTRAFARRKQRGWAVYSALTGVLFFGGFASIASASGAAWSILAFTAAVLLIWAWITAISAHALQTITTSTEHPTSSNTLSEELA